MRFEFMVNDQAAGGFFQCPDLKELYSRKYDDKMNRWRAICAIDKANNIALMLTGVSPAIGRVLEVGCGNGAVLERIAAKKIGSCFTGIEIGTERSQAQQRDDLQIHGYDGCNIPYGDKNFDLVYATHVLEHVTDERGFLHELRRVSQRFVYVEVPCELHLRSTRRALQQSLGIGHINAYTPESFALQLETSGLIVKSLRLFDPRYEIHRFNSSAWRAIVKSTTRKGLLSLSQSMAARIFTYHCGALCVPGPRLCI
jgi:ubiquinone/menaquinone biosynthesis C-methylase UbiE